MMCQTIGFPPISTRGLGRTSVCSTSLVPAPPHRITTGTLASDTRRLDLSMLIEVVSVPRDRRRKTVLERELRCPPEHAACFSGVEALLADFVRRLVPDVRRQIRRHR